MFNVQLRLTRIWISLVLSSLVLKWTSTILGWVCGIGVCWPGRSLEDPWKPFKLDPPVATPFEFWDALGRGWKANISSLNMLKSSATSVTFSAGFPYGTDFLGFLVFQGCHNGRHPREGILTDSADILKYLEIWNWSDWLFSRLEIWMDASWPKTFSCLSKSLWWDVVNVVQFRTCVCGLRQSRGSRNSEATAPDWSAKLPRCRIGQIGQSVLFSQTVSGCFALLFCARLLWDGEERTL